eukprot:GSChrysophyteH1.ASY1.ANO1.23.1 assembled CDS
MFKYLQRRCYTFLNTSFGMVVLVIAVWTLLYEAIYLMSGASHSHPIMISDELRYDNIGGVDFKENLSYGPIDIVYTWVNGNNKRQEIGGNATSKSRLNDTMSLSNTSSNGTIAKDENRYRDSDELRYSIRSIVKNAPWVRRIFLVTDNQIPYWLNLDDNIGRITIVSHEDIFPNKSHLPVFSSPAIESHIHRISGLSRYFIYFNDDVFLGRPTSPEDFMTISGSQKFHLSWDVPKCSTGCSDSWIGDGFCDRACNVSACNFDFPDCVNATKDGWHSSVNDDKNSRKEFCSKGCPDGWLGDRVCDSRCKNADCAWDMGDCGIGRMTFLNYSQTATNSSSSNNTNALDRRDKVYAPVTLTVPIGTKAVYFNLTHIFSGNRYLSGNHSASDIVHNGMILYRHDILLVTLYNSVENLPKALELPHYSIKGYASTCTFPRSAANVLPLKKIDIAERPFPFGAYSNNLASYETKDVYVSYKLSTNGVVHNKTHKDLQTQHDPESEIPKVYWGVEKLNYLTLLIPVPQEWSQSEATWIHAKVKILHKRSTSKEEAMQDFIEYHGIYGGHNDIPAHFEQYYNISNTNNSNSDTITKVFTMTNDSYRRRRLDEDTYAKSLVHVNRLYTKKFGAEARKVPAHMPHMIDKSAVKEMQALWENEWNVTSSNKFRSSDDMQYSFSYYYYMMNRYTIQEIDLKAFISLQIDSDQDGYLNDNEFRTLATIATDSDKEALQTTLTIHPWPSVSDAVSCGELIKDGLQNKIDRKQLFQTHTTGSDKVIAFEMIGDNYTDTLRQLDSVRERQPKFICINDNMVDPSQEVLSVLKDFFESFWPIPSRFELPSHVINSELHYDEYLKLKNVSYSNFQELIRDEEPRLLGTFSRLCNSFGKLLLQTYRYVKIITLEHLHKVVSYTAANIEGAIPVDSNGPQVKNGESRADIARIRRRHLDDHYIHEFLVLSLLALVTTTFVYCLYRRTRRSRRSSTEPSEEEADQ